MKVKNRSKKSLRKTVFGWFFAIILGIFGATNLFIFNNPVFAVPEENDDSSEQIEATDGSNDESDSQEDKNTDDESSEQENTNDSEDTSDDDSNNTRTGVLTLSSEELESSCQDNLGSIGWLVCPTTGKISEAVDWLYEKIEGILAIEPISTNDDSPFYLIWKYCLGVANIVFVIFLLVVIYSQITGLGISNYGLKKVLPKLIVVAIMVNLSFLVCSLAVDLSNIIGNGLRGVFTTVEESVLAAQANNAIPAQDLSDAVKVSYSDMYSSLAGGVALSIGGVAIAFESGAIWMLIPVVLGALVAVVSGLITIALRQTVVALLIMISPLAIVAHMLPNTENLYKKWLELLKKMLVFYPMFSLLFGASSLAGFAIIMGAKDGFGLLLGTAVQIFPLFFSWSLMKMSGTFLGTINEKMRGLAAKPLAANKAWAESRRNLTKQKYLASGRTPSAHLMQFLSDRKIAREAEMAEKADKVKNRGLAYYANSHYRSDGSISRKGEKAYADQADVMKYTRAITRDKNNLNMGYGDLKKAARDSSQAARLAKLDRVNTVEANLLSIEKARGEMIDRDNAVNFHERVEDSYKDYLNREHAGERDYAERSLNISTASEAKEMYDKISDIMEGNMVGIQYAGATAASLRDSYQNIVQNKMKSYYSKTVPTENVMLKLHEIAKREDVMKNIDYVVPGLRELNVRGDTDKVREIIEEAFESNGGGIELGTHASQSLMGVVQFDVGNGDPFLKKFGKHLNVQTAKVYDNGERKNKMTSFDEYIKGYYYEEGSDQPIYVKTGIEDLIKGVSLDAMERTALPNLEEIVKHAYTTKNEDGTETFDQTAYIDKIKRIRDSMMPAFIASTLKYPSGSEGLMSEVAFLTGLTKKPIKDENGLVKLDNNGEPEMEWVAAWDNLSGKEREELRDYYIDNAAKYLDGSTPQQILAYRSDFNNPFAYLYAMDYLKSDSYDDEEEENKNKYRERMADLIEEYGIENDVDLLNNSKGRKLLEEMRSDDAMKRLSDRGLISYFERMSKRSSAVSGSKDWLREMIKLDPGNTKELDKWVKLEKEKRRRRYSGSNNAPDSNSVSSSPISEGARSTCRAYLDNLWNTSNYRLEDDAADYYEKTVEILKRYLGETSDEVRDYERYYEEIKDSATVNDLKDFIEDFFLGDEE